MAMIKEKRTRARGEKSEKGWMMEVFKRERIGKRGRRS
jgi:hypothetical protein